MDEVLVKVFVTIKFHKPGKKSFLPVISCLWRTSLEQD